MKKAEKSASRTKSLRKGERDPPPFRIVRFVQGRGEQRNMDTWLYIPLTSMFSSLQLIIIVNCTSSFS